MRAKAWRNRAENCEIMPIKSTFEVRQGTGPRAMFWVLIGSLALAVIAGFALGITFGWLPRPWS
jgi:hypothetical protein